MRWGSWPSRGKVTSPPGPCGELSGRFGQAVQGEHHGHPAADDGPEPGTFEMGGHVGGDQGHAKTDQDGKQRMGSGEKDLVEVGG